MSGECPITGMIGCDGKFHRDDCWDRQYEMAVEMMLEGAKKIEELKKREA